VVLGEVMEIERDVVEVFHGEEVELVESALRSEVRLDKSRESVIEGGGRTGPVGGQKAVERGRRRDPMMKLWKCIFYGLISWRRVIESLIWS
jgi:hypothetical protein